MSHFEAEPSPDSDPRLDVANEYELGVNVSLRFNVYQYAADGRDVHQEIADGLDYHAGDVILDAGCADGRELNRIARVAKVPLHLMGLDISDSALELIKPTSFHPHKLSRIQGNIANMPLQDSSVDTVLSLFTLYHVPQPEKAIAEFRRIIKSDGTLVIATSGAENKQKHRMFEEEIAEYLEVRPSPRFAITFGPEEALEAISKHFEVIETHNHHSNILVNNIPSYMDYLLSLQSMKDTFRPMPSGREWREAVLIKVIPVIANEFAETGAFCDPIDRHYYVCRPK